MHLATARIAWGCHVAKSRDSTGKEIDVPLYDYTQGFNVQPKLFPFDLKVRSQEKMRILQQAVRLGIETDPLG